MNNADEKEDNNNEYDPKCTALVEVMKSPEDVKSQAVVKYCNILLIKQHEHLECNTNLNHPPCNWMFKYSSAGALLHQALHETPCFTSFQIAHMFSSSVGEVDVVSDAENIKKLLKLPFQTNGVISMIVHKVGNTLLLDEFDVQRYLARRSKNDWKWLDKFFSAHILPLCTNYHNFFFSDKSRAASKTRSLLSKFLYRSLRGDDVEISTKYPKTTFPRKEPLLPEPKTVDNVPQLVEQPHTFNRNVLWTFEDICMLIGTDMPIFGGPSRPCISLRLRDMAEPINVLTGVDYWLDNLMCNVPEVVMCYHIDGIVQKYEIIKTEDLPNLENSQFSPQVVHNVAQNILAFLKANATKAGHTYWLFKGRDDDVVKLYDLSTLSTLDTDGETDKKTDESATPNPFTVPVAMLLYSVARNMKHNRERCTPKRAGAIRSLLTNCVKLLDKEKYPQIVSSSHYILSDLYIPVGIDPKEPVFDMTDDDSECWDEESYASDSDDELQSEQQQREQNLQQQQQAQTEQAQPTQLQPQDVQANGHQQLQQQGQQQPQTVQEEQEKPLTNEQLEKSTAELLKMGVMVVKPYTDVLKAVDAETKKKLIKEKKKNVREPLPLIASTMERCRKSLSHISAGISCLQFFDMNEERLFVESEARAKDEERQRIIHEEQHINMAKPFKPIPLPYVTLTDKQHTSTDDAAAQTSSGEGTKMCAKSENIYEIEKIRQQQMQTKEKVTDSFNHQNFGSWNVHLKLLFLEKACLIYATLAEFEYLSQKYGAALQYNIMATRCQTFLLKHIKKSYSQKSALVARTGDCFLQIAKNFNNYQVYLTQYKDVIEQEEGLFNELIKDLKENEKDQLFDPLENVEQLLLCSILCYQRAIEFNKLVNPDDEEGFLAKKELYRRLGNANNELGLKLMYWAQEIFSAAYGAEECDKFLQNFKLQDKVMDLSKLEDFNNSTRGGAMNAYYLHLADKSRDALHAGIQAFQVGEDHINLAFLYCNLGRYFRFRAHLSRPDGTYDFGNCLETQRRYYKDAFNSYEKALEVIETRKKNPELWDIVQWECSTALFNLAKYLQDSGIYFEKNSLQETEKIILDLLHKALSSCWVDQPGPRQVLYAFRAGLLHKRIASFHYNQVRNSWPGKSKFSLKLCQFHYEKASEIFEKLNEFPEWLVVLLELVQVTEYLAEKASNQNAKCSFYNMALLTITRKYDIFDKLVLALTEDNGVPGFEMNSTLKAYTDGGLFNLLSMTESRLQFILRDTLKHIQMNKDPKKYSLFKQMYLETLKGRFLLGVQNNPTIPDLITKISDFAQLLKNHFEMLSFV